MVFVILGRWDSTWLVCLQNNFVFPTCKNSQKRVKNPKSTDKHSSFDGLIQEYIDLSDTYLAVARIQKKSPEFTGLYIPNIS